MENDKKIAINMKMRTSTKIILAAFVIFAVSLTVYNSALKAEYLTGRYKDEFRDFINYDIKDFDEVQVNASRMVHVFIRQGNFSVRKADYTDIPLTFVRDGHRLIIGVDYKIDPLGSRNSKDIKVGYNQVIITCPNLKWLMAEDFYTVNGRIPNKIGNAVPTNDEFDHSVIVSAFKLDTLSIQQVTGAVELDADKIGTLNAKLEGSSKLIIGTRSRIDKAKLQVDDKSVLNMPDVKIPSLSLKVADSAKVSLTGASLNIIIGKSNH